MTEFNLNDNIIELPDNWMEVSFGDFVGFTKLIQNFVNREAANKNDVTKEWENALLDLKDNTQILCYWSKLTEEQVSMLDIDVAANLMNHLTFLNESYVPIHIESFVLKEEKFYLPVEFMQKSSFGRYIEAEQLELHSNMLDKGNLDILPRQIAILCKKEGESEKLDDGIIDKRAEMFKKLDMATIWDVAFFLNKLEQRLVISSLTFQEVEEMQKQG
tara:strand:+ start:536 stop:1186 length:651 start_codon:yes stop_codon:yes gene_type:complete